MVLDKIFGAGWQNFSVNSSGFLPTILSFYDTILFAVLGVIAIYSLSMGIAEAAHDGVPLGKRYSKWMPFRIIFASAFLAPVSSAGGISVVQNVLLYIVGLSISMANGIWDSGISFLVKSGPALIESQSTGTDLARQVFKSLVCMDYINDEYYYIGQGTQTGLAVGTAAAPTLPAGPTNYVTINTISSTFTITSSNAAAFGLPSTTTTHPTQVTGISFDGTPGSGLPPAICGRFLYNGSAGAEGSALANAQMTALSAMIKSLSTTAAQFENQSTGAIPPRSAIYSAIGSYQSSVGAAVAALESQTNGPALSSWQSTAKTAGWLSAGSYFYSFSQQNQKLSELASRKFAYFGPAVSSVADPSMGKGGFTLRNVLNSADSYTSLLDTAGNIAGNPVTSSALQTATGAVSESGAYGKFLSYLINPFNSMIQGFSNLLSQNGDPLLTLQSFGDVLITGGEAIIIATFGADSVITGGAKAAKGVAQAADSIPIVGGLIGGVVSATAGAASGVAAVLMKVGTPIMLLVVVPIIIFGAELAYIMPLLPSVLWILSVGVWILLVLEALFAVPLWGILHALPEGEGFLSPESRSGYVKLMDLFIRPAIMSIGFFAAFFFIETLARLVSWSLGAAISSVTANSLTGIVGFIAIAGVVVHLLLLLVYRAFHATATLPDKIIQWAGGWASGGSEEGDGEKVRVNAGAVVSGHGNAAQSAGREAAREGKAGGSPDGGGVPAVAQSEAGADSASTTDYLSGGQQKGGFTYPLVSDSKPQIQTSSGGAVGGGGGGMEPAVTQSTPPPGATDTQNLDNYLSGRG